MTFIMCTGENTSVGWDLMQATGESPGHYVMPGPRIHSLLALAWES